MTKIVYVTGCLGFIGYHVAKECLDKGWWVRGIDSETYASNLNLLPHLQKYSNFYYEKTDINDLKHLYDCDYVINTAAETHVDNSIVSSHVFLHSNINGVYNLLELIKGKPEHRRPILLHFSTDEVYGDIEVGSHVETDLLKPSNPYSATKAAADMLILAWARTYNIPFVIVRPTNNYGVGQYVEKLIPKTVKYLMIGRKVELHDNGTPVRTWLHASDTSKAIITIVDKGVRNEIYNISGNYQTKNIEVVNKIVKIMKLKGSVDNYVAHSKRMGQDVRYSIDDTKLKKLNWNATANFDKELRKIVNYYTNNFIW